MRTFSTRGAKAIWDSHGPQKTLSVYGSGSTLIALLSYHLSAVITDGSSIKEFPFIILLGGEASQRERMEAFTRVKLGCRSVCVNAGFMHRVLTSKHMCIKAERH